MPMLPTILYILAMTSASNSLNSLRPDSGAQIAPLATHNMSLEKRYGNTFVNDVFKDNILLTLNYMDGKVKAASDINWAEVEKPAKYEFTLKPGEEFTFHDQVLAAYKGNIVKSTNAHFNYTDGFKSDGYLTGDGVCHLASLIYWTAKDAGLTAIAPRNHDFANIPEVPREYGVSIYDLPGDPGSSQYQNLYITNNKEKDVKFVFEYKDNILTISVVEKE